MEIRVLLKKGSGQGSVLAGCLFVPFITSVLNGLLVNMSKMNTETEPEEVMLLYVLVLQYFIVAKRLECEVSEITFIFCISPVRVSCISCFLINLIIKAFLSTLVTGSR